MCGLVGMVGTLEYKHKKAMMDLLFLDTLRGKDSTGLTAVKRNRTCITRKMTVPGYEFIEHPAVVKMMEHNDQLWLAHNRFKTTGDINKQNAHPFEVCDQDDGVLLIGAHNGTLSNKYEIERELKEKYDTDSEGLFNLLTLAKDYKEAIGMLKGAWSLVWWDAPENRLHFCRNKERPMVYAFTKDRKVLVWASEAWMIINACRRNDVELLKNDKDLSCYATLPDNLYTMEIPQERDKVLPDFIREGGYSGAPEGRFQQARERYHDWWYGLEDDPNTPWDDDVRFVGKKPEEDEKGTKETTTLGTPPKKEVIDIVLEPDMARGYEGRPIKRTDLAKLKDEGCVWAGCKIDKVYAFVEEKAMICGDCLRDTHRQPGDCVLSELGKAQKDSPEYKRLIDAAVLGAKAVG